MNSDLVPVINNQYHRFHKKEKTDECSLWVIYMDVVYVGNARLHDAGGRATSGTVAEEYLPA
jgi:hypothetical protein